MFTFNQNKIIRKVMSTQVTAEAGLRYLGMESTLSIGRLARPQFSFSFLPPTKDTAYLVGLN